MNETLRVEKAATALQRPLILVLMALACPGMLVLSGMALTNLVIPAISGDQPLKEGANPFLAYGLLALTFLVPIFLSWVSGKIALKAWRQIKEKGVLYKER